MYRLTILYGAPTDPEHFRRYYREVHIPLARHMTGLTAWNLSWMDDASEYILVAELYTPDRAAMDEVLASPAGTAARDDLDNFVTGGVLFLAGTEEEVALA